jgi:hypothetical protein
MRPARSSARISSTGEKGGEKGGAAVWWEGDECIPQL